MTVCDTSLLLQKWKRANQPEEIFSRFPDFVRFLDRSKLLSQLKITKDQVSILDDEPAMIVEGQLVKASAIMQRFSIANSKEFQDRFVVDRTSNVYTYLDNGKGLQKYHPYLSVGEIPISRINDDELRKVQALAHRFIRPNESIDRLEENQNRSFVLQIVSSYTHRGNSRLSETLRNPRHAFIRVVAGADITDLNVKKGDVWEFGFGWKRNYFFPMAATQGRFRSPDPWEYVPCDERFVTHIAISDEEAKHVFQYVLDYQRRNVQLGRELGFQLAQHNCSVFVREAAKQAGIEIPTETRLPELLGRIAPQILKNLGNQISQWVGAAVGICRNCIRKHAFVCLSRGIFEGYNKVASVFRRGIETLIALVLTPIRAMLGGLNGQGGDALDSRNGGKVSPPAWQIKNWFNLASYSCHLPALIQDWQKKQASTIVFQNPVRLTAFSN